MYAPSDLAELERRELEAALAARGSGRFRARQIFRVDLPARRHRPRRDDRSAARAARGARRGFHARRPRRSSPRASIDGTEKFLLRLADGRQIESVFIPDTPAMTFCISTQVGCAMACAFCLTGKMGLVRNLTAGEIVGQVRVLADALDLRDKAFNIVLMGMGEPLHNYDETMKALRILADEHGFAHAAAAGDAVDGRPAAGARAAGARAADAESGDLAARADRRAARRARADQQEIRRRATSSRPASAFRSSKRSRITFEYVLLAGVNDSPEDARRLARLLAGVKSKVNLIPLNAAAGHSVRAAVGRRRSTGSRRFSPNAASTVSVRKSRGRDIRAACGQLIVEGQRKSPAQQLAVIALTTQHALVNRAPRHSAADRRPGASPGGIRTFR